MSESTRGKVCPLLAIAAQQWTPNPLARTIDRVSEKPTSVESKPEFLATCVEEHCALWADRAKRCSILHLAIK